jgi:glycerophosphoryl diester phosphodiesterase
VLLVAHRTPASAERCARLAAAGAQVFEVDVQLRSGHIAVSHFLPLGRRGFVQRDNWRLRWHTAATRDPALAEVDAVVPPGCTVMLDIKETAAARRRDLAAAVVETLTDRARYVVCGPDAEDLEHVRAAGFRTWRTAGTGRELAALLADGAAPDEAVSIRHSLLRPESLARLHELTTTVVAWTVNDLGRARQLRDLGVDGVTTDRAAVLHDLAGAPQAE